MVDFNPELEKHLKDMDSRRPTDSTWLFPSPRREEEDRAARTFRESLILARKAADLPTFGFHDYHVVIASNNRLRIALDGDEEAWGRRLLVVDFEKPKPAKPIPNFAEKLATRRGPPRGCDGPRRWSGGWRFSSSRSPDDTLRSDIASSPSANSVRSG